MFTSAEPTDPGLLTCRTHLHLRLLRRRQRLVSLMKMYGWCSHQRTEPSVGGSRTLNAYRYSGHLPPGLRAFLTLLAHIVLRQLSAGGSSPSVRGRHASSLHQTSDDHVLKDRKHDYCKMGCFIAVFQIICKFAPKAFSSLEAFDNPGLARSFIKSARRIPRGNAQHEVFESGTNAGPLARTSYYCRGR